MLEEIRTLNGCDKKVVAQIESKSGYAKAPEGVQILNAVREYSEDRPWQRVAKVAASSSRTFVYALTLVNADWTEEFQVQDVKWPLSQRGPSLDDDENKLDKASWNVFQSEEDESWQLEFFALGNSPPSSDFAVYYTMPHSFLPVADTTSIPIGDQPTVSALAAANIVGLAIATAAQWGDANQVGTNLSGILEGLERLQARLRKVYDDKMAKRKRERGPIMVEHDVPGTYGERIFHSRRQT